MKPGPAWNWRVISSLPPLISLPVIVGLAMATPALATDELGDVFNHIHKAINALKYSDKTGVHRYDIVRDPDFPCSISLREHNDFEGSRWIRRYRFELSDLEPGKMLVTKDQRRTISYYGEKISKGKVKKFPSRKIAAIRLYAPSDNPLHNLFDKAIQFCEERNTF